MNKPTMTLTEYLAQTKPVKLPIVNLQQNEYTVTYRYLYKGIEPVALIMIHAYPNVEYAQRGKSKQLLTVDQDGNFNKESCFWLLNSETDNIK